MRSMLSGIKPVIDQAVSELVYGKPKKPKAIVAKAIQTIVLTNRKGE